jgi:hypothetical protein
MAETALTPIEIGLTAAIVGVEAGEPAILVAGDDKSDVHAGLPFGPFDPLAHRTFEIGLRAWVEQQTGLRVGYVEQLYTFGDRGRHAGPADEAHMVSVGYLALTRIPSATALKAGGAGFEPWYRFFPWEDWRKKRPAILDDIIPLLDRWTGTPHGELGRALGWRERLRLCFGVGGSPWDEEKVLDRYEMLYEAGLPHPRHRDRAAARQAEIPAGGVRTDVGRIHADGIAAHRRGDLGPGAAQAEFPAARRRHRTGRTDRRHLDRDRRAPCRPLPLPARGFGRATGPGLAAGRSRLAVIPAE